MGVLLDATLLKYAGIVVPTGEHDEEKEKSTWPPCVMTKILGIESALFQLDRADPLHFQTMLFFALYITLTSFDKEFTENFPFFCFFF